MCGIAGSVGPGSTATPLDEMLAAIEHRGPDGRGTLRRPGLTAGMVRLAIIDLAHGDQPKASDDGAVQVLLNGEIYNHRALRDELARAGRSFESDSDTEVVATAFAHWGEGALQRLDGMFAVAVWSEHERTLLLARDRFGEKPLYLRHHDGGIDFASEPKALAAARPLGEIDETAIAEYLHLGYIPAPRSAWTAVEKVAAGHRVVIDDDGTVTRRGPYWTLAPDTTSTMSGLGDLEVRLRSSVQRALVSDVEVGVLLSGGIDSSLVAWFASEAQPGIRAFTVKVDDPERDESPHAAAIAAELGMTSEVLPITGDHALGLVDDLPDVYDEPFADQSALPTLLIARFAASKVKVVLGGDGGDELFSGYTPYAEAERLAGLASRIPTPVMAAARPLARSRSALLSRLGNMADKAHPHPSDSFRVIRSHLSRSLVAGLVDPSPLDDLAGRFRSLAPDGDLRRIDLATYLPDNLLVKVDRATMSTSLEARAPFLDPALATWALGLPRATIGPPGAKELPRRLVDHRFGTRHGRRPKQGFSVPLDRWLRGPLAGSVAEHLSEDRVRDAGLVRWDGVDLLLDRLAAGRSGAANSVWNLLTLHRWAAK